MVKEYRHPSHWAQKNRTLSETTIVREFNVYRGHVCPLLTLQ